MTNDKQKPNSLRNVLDAEAKSLDAITLGKLRQARRSALEQETGRTILDWLPAGNVATATGAVTAAAAVAVLTFWFGVISPQARVNTIEDAELLASADNTELYENIEFYEWLESQQQKREVDAG